MSPLMRLGTSFASSLLARASVYVRVGIGVSLAGFVPRLLVTGQQRANMHAVLVLDLLGLLFNNQAAEYQVAYL